MLRCQPRSFSTTPASQEPSRPGVVAMWGHAAVIAANRRRTVKSVSPSISSGLPFVNAVAKSLSQCLGMVWRRGQTAAGIPETAKRHRRRGRRARRVPRRRVDGRSPAHSPMTAEIVLDTTSLKLQQQPSRSNRSSPRQQRSAAQRMPFRPPTESGKARRNAVKEGAATKHTRRPTGEGTRGSPRTPEASSHGGMQRAVVGGV